MRSWLRVLVSLCVSGVLSAALAQMPGGTPAAIAAPSGAVLSGSSAGDAVLPARQSAASVGAPLAAGDRLQTTAGGLRALEDAAAVRSAGTVEADRQRHAAAGPLDATEFQRFVQESTGRSLPLFGYELFSGVAYPSAQNIPVPADYVVGPGDELEIRLWGSVEAEMRVGVDRNGQVNIPRVGTFNISGTRAAQLDSVLRAQIGRVYSNFQLNVTLAQLRSIQVFVVGQARKPGAYSVSGLSTLVGALFQSGGPAATGSMRNIQLRRDGKVVTTLDLYRFINEGDKSADVRLLPGDVIFYPPAGPRVALTGAIDTPAVFELSGPEEPLGTVLAYAGRTQALTALHKVQVERIDNRARTPRSVEERSLDSLGLRSMVQDGDVVTLFRISPEFSNAVTLRGSVASPLRHAYRPGMRVSDLIPERAALIVPDYHARRNLLVQYEGAQRPTDARVQSEVKNLLDEINWDYAVVERLDRQEVRSRLLPFNLAKAVVDRDPSEDLALQPGDVVTVFSVKELPVPLSKRSQYVRISGEVQVPGVYELRPGETLDLFVRRIGGLSRDAYPFGIVFTRESTRVQQQRNLEQAVRRMEADINSQAIAAAQGADGGTKESLQANLAAQRLLIARLQTLRASGRVALEVDPRTNVLPPIRLEDGDQIVVPNTPSFVSVFGAVQAETSFIHRFNFTVREYLERAGPNRDADLDQVAVVRADGSVESNLTFRRGLFGGMADILERRLHPGDSVFVPEKFDKRSGYSKFVEGAKDWTTIFYQLGLGAVGLKVLRD